MVLLKLRMRAQGRVKGVFESFILSHRMILIFSSRGYLSSSGCSTLDSTVQRINQYPGDKY